MEDPEERLAERVEQHTEWDGELNEIVHYTRKGASGRDVLINILLSDEPGSFNNKDIIFSDLFNHFGVKIGVNNNNEYCVVMDYASELGTNINNNFLVPGKQSLTQQRSYQRMSGERFEPRSIPSTPSKYL